MFLHQPMMSRVHCVPVAVSLYLPENLWGHKLHALLYSWFAKNCSFFLPFKMLETGTHSFPFNCQCTTSNKDPPLLMLNDWKSDLCEQVWHCLYPCHWLHSVPPEWACSRVAGSPHWQQHEPGTPLLWVCICTNWRECSCCNKGLLSNSYYL